MIEIDPSRAGSLATNLGSRDAATSILRAEIAENGQTERVIASAAAAEGMRGECEALRERVRAQEGTIQSLLGILGTAAQRLGASEAEVKARLEAAAAKDAANRQAAEDCAAVCDRCRNGLSEARLGMYGARVWLHADDSSGDFDCHASAIREAVATRNGEALPTVSLATKLDDIPF